MTTKMQRLMAQVLDRQAEPEAEFDDLAFATAVRDGLQAGEPLRADLARLVWTSPGARSIYTRLRAEAVAAARARWSERGFAVEFERRAADSSEDTDTFSAAGVEMRMVRSAAAGQWLISLQVVPDAMRDLPPGIAVRVSDSGGMIWLEGPLDRRGGLDGYWQDETTSPRARLREHSLTIALI